MRVQAQHKACTGLSPTEIQSSLFFFFCSSAVSDCKEVKNNTKMSTLHVSVCELSSYTAASFLLKGVTAFFALSKIISV